MDVEMDRNDADVVLVVDLDETLVRTDLLWEAIVLFIRGNLRHSWRLLHWVWLGKAAFKERLAALVDIDPACLPYDRAIIDEVQAQRRLGRKIVLATGSHRNYAHLVASHLKLFDVVLATDGPVNLTAAAKARELVKLYGEKGFDYIGNGRVDIPVWCLSRIAYSCGRRPSRLTNGMLTRSIGEPRESWPAALLSAMRPRQWLKNLLVFVPMLAGHALTVQAAVQSLVAFIAFCLCASSAYLLNDALDAQHDRLHPTKKERPMASGKLALSHGLVACLLLALAGLALCAFWEIRLFAVVLTYFASTICYSLFLKQLYMVDIVVLALLYGLRIVGGAVGTGIVLSSWLLSFSFFIFLSLAMLKRHSETLKVEQAGVSRVHGRGYLPSDNVPIGVMGICCGFLSVVIFMLYFNSDNVVRLYSSPLRLFGIVPLLVFWIGRLWLLSFRGRIDEDPVLFVSRDRVSLATIVASLAIAVAASL